MKEFIQSLINGYEAPVFFSDAQRGTILYSNEAAHQKLGIPKEQLNGQNLNDLLTSNRVIQDQPVWKVREEHYLVHNEELNLSGDDYIKSVLKPFQENATLYYLNFQKEMVSRMVHRLHSPLNGTSGFVELLKGTGLSEKQQEYVEEIESGLNDLKSVLAQLRTLAENISVHLTDVDTYLLADQLVEAIPAEQQERVEIAIDDEASEIQSDFLLLKSILLELLHNAFQHGPQDNSPIQVQFKAGRISVQNKGPAIDHALASKLFSPFFSSKARSLGLGLAKCKTYAFELGYELKLAENSSEKGIRFELVFDRSRK